MPKLCSGDCQNLLPHCFVRSKMGDGFVLQVPPLAYVEALPVCSLQLNTNIILRSNIFPGVSLVFVPVVRLFIMSVVFVYLVFNSRRKSPADAVSSRAWCGACSKCTQNNPFFGIRPSQSRHLVPRMTGRIFIFSCFSARSIASSAPMAFCGASAAQRISFTVDRTCSSGDYCLSHFYYPRAISPVRCIL